MYKKKNTNVKLVVLLVVLMLLIGGTIGGTMAWLIANTDPVVNTFTVGNIAITLDEDAIAAADRTAIKMVPGAKIAKDPKVTVKEDSEACWLFVEVKAENTADFITYDIASGWTLVDGTTNVYSREVAASDKDQEFYILAGTGTGDYEHGYVTVKDTVTKAMMDELANGTAGAPTLTFTAWAVQKANDDGTFAAGEAWNIAQGKNPDGSAINSQTP